MSLVGFTSLTAWLAFSFTHNGPNAVLFVTLAGAMGERFIARRRKLRRATLLVGSCLVLYCFLFLVRPLPQTTTTSKPISSELQRNLSLDEEQCRATFPGLMKEIDDAVAEGPFTLKNTGQDGLLQARIKDGQLYILHAQRRADLSTEMLNSRTAALHQLHRALVTSPSPLPDMIVTLNIQDQPFGTSLTYSRPSSPSLSSTSRYFLIPHFSFWSWPLPSVHSIPYAASRITALEDILAFRSKIPKAVWRGTVWFNSISNPRLRPDLIKVVRASKRRHEWADVEAMDGDKKNGLNIWDFCRYKYVIHTEGVTYSGRFQFLQMCGSVVITPPISWMQHTSHLVRPVFSGDLLGRDENGVSEGVKGAWPTRYKAEEANIVFVRSDWSDLEEVVEWLEEHPSVAEGIARRQREMFVGGGYFSQAAEVCYWRALIRGWARVVRVEEREFEGMEGVPFEEFVLTGGR